jgi:glycosyltransferase involved in cell wall biosynthesis
MPADKGSATPVRVLYVDGVGQFGGASRSLFEAVHAFPPNSVEALFVVQRGTILPWYGKVATDIIATRGLTRFDNTRYSHYRGVRWLVLLRELAYAPFTVLAMIRAKLRWRRVDVIHANEVTEILPLLLARALFGAPIVVHVRAVQQSDRRSLRTRFLHALLRRCDAVVAIDENVRATLPADMRVDVVHNSFTSQPASAPDVAITSRLDALAPGALRIGFIGNLHHSKGLLDLLDAAKLVQSQGCLVEYVIVGGSTRGDVGLAKLMLRAAGLSQDVGEIVARRIGDYGLTNRVHLLGPTADIQAVFQRIDVLCFPSHFDAPGRPVFEAAFSGVPAIVAVTAPQPDTLVPGETGLAVPGKDAEKLAKAIRYFADNRAEVSRMGANARRLAERNFVPELNSRQLMGVYARVLSVIRPEPNRVPFAG